VRKRKKEEEDMGKIIEAVLDPEGPAGFLLFLVGGGIVIILGILMGIVVVPFIIVKTIVDVLRGE